MTWRPGGTRVRPDSLESGERVLAGAAGAGSEWSIAVTRAALHLRSPLDGQWSRQPWHGFHSAGWNAAEGLLVLRHRGPEGSLVSRSVPVPGVPRVLEILRERIASTVVVQRSADVGGGLVSVTLRRGVGAADVRQVWVEVDAGDGVDLENPQVSDVVAALEARVREESGTPALAPTRECC